MAGSSPITTPSKITLLRAVRGARAADRCATITPMLTSSSWRQEYGAPDARGPTAEQAGKLETRALFARSQGGTVARAGGNTCAPRPVRLDLKAPAAPRSDTDGTGSRHGLSFLVWSIVISGARSGAHLR